MELNFLEIFGTIVGLIYLWLEYRGKYLPLDSGHCDACHLHLRILQSRIVC